MKKMEMEEMEKIEGGISGQSVANCVGDAYSNHGWVSVAATIISAWIPFAVVAITASCIGKNIRRKTISGDSGTCFGYPCFQIKNNIMKLFTYYLLIVLPIPFIYLIYQILHNAAVFIFLVVAYVFVYRALIDGFRLQRLGLLEKGGLWKMFMPFYIFRLRYFYELYFENR